MWTHDFVCLGKADQQKTPTDMERSKLVSAGKLGSSCAKYSLINYQYAVHY